MIELHKSGCLSQSQKVDQVPDVEYGVSEVSSIAQALKEERIKSGLTQEQFAQKLGTKRAYISRLENGKYDIQLSTLFHIFEALGHKIKLTII